MIKDGFDRRKERAVQTRERLYASADRLFLQHGVDAVSVDAIVEDAGVSKGAFYVHFQSKDELASALIGDYVSKIDMDYQSYLDRLPPGHSAVDTLLGLVGEIFDVIENRVGCERIKVLYRAQIVHPGDAQKASGYSRALYAMLGDVLERGMRSGEFKQQQPAEELARHMMLAMRGLTYEWCIRYPDFPLKEQAVAHFRMLLEGIAVKG